MENVWPEETRNRSKEFYYYMCDIADQYSKLFCLPQVSPVAIPPMDASLYPMIAIRIFNPIDMIDYYYTMIFDRGTPEARVKLFRYWLLRNNVDITKVTCYR